MNQSLEGQIRFYRGIANPSGAVALDASHFLCGDDEINQLLLYSFEDGSKPLQTFHLSEIFKGQIEDGKKQEIDLEAATFCHELCFWIGSHSTNKDGKARPARQRLFALEVEKFAAGYEVRAHGQIYTRLIDDLIDDPRFARFELDQARKIPPKAPGGLSIEGLSTTSNNELLIGFRNPLYRQQTSETAEALIVRLLNPLEVIQGQPARFGEPITLSLGGLGIRDMTPLDPETHLIVAGPYDSLSHQTEASGSPFKLFSWNENSKQLNPLTHVNLGSLNVEAIMIVSEAPKQICLLSDDGKLSEQLQFRSLTLSLT